MLIIPEGYFREDDCACGLNGVKNDLIPDFIMGLNVKEACCVHDWMYESGKAEGGERHRQYADRVFLQNLLFLIDQGKGSWFLRAARKAVAYKYFVGVRLFAGPIYRSRSSLKSTDSESAKAS